MPGAQSPPKSLRQRFRRLLALNSSLIGAVVVAGLGWVFAFASRSVGDFGSRERPTLGWIIGAVGEKFARLSFDVPFVLRGTAPIPKACVILLDENSARILKQRGCIWDRRLHTQLLRRLADDKPLAVFFDIVFSDESEDPAVDADFAAAIKENGSVFLAGAVENEPGVPLTSGTRMLSRQIIPPTDVLREAVLDNWGLIEFEPIDADYGVRRINTGGDDMASAPWRMAVVLGGKLVDTDEARVEPRWMNFYGPADTFPMLPYAQVLAEADIKPGYFHDRIVFVGGRSTLSTLGAGKEDYRNPFGLLGGSFSPGVEVHLNAMLNLLNGEWLTRLDSRIELSLVVFIGLLLGGALPRFRPHAAALLAGIAIVAIGTLAYWLFMRHRVWFAWCVPALVQAPVALAWSIGARYFLEERRRRALRNAFGHYLSPHIADRIADSDFDLSPGGAVVEASVLFTDLEGFTPLTESLNNPELVTEILVKYFTQTTSHILDHEGTILNFVGDAVTAVWGAPLADPEHARKAALAACRLHESARIEVDGHILRTRVGLHTGRVLAGNIGSAARFDYAVVGDPVNFASRLEGLNKFLGTNVLVSDDMRQQLGDGFGTRRLGEFRVVGRKQSCVIHELFSPSADDVPAAWRDYFANALAAFQSGNLDEAERLMHETLALRDGRDGPAQFYIGHIARLRKSPLPLDWSGIVAFEEK